MRVSSSNWLSLVLVLVAVAVLFSRFILPHFAKPDTKAEDLSVTSPLNQPGGGAIPSEAYEVYSALYQQPLQEPLAIAEDSRTDIPQVNGSCLTPSTPEEREMADAFVAANQQSHRWEKKFSIPAEYQLLPGSMTGRVQDCISREGRNGPGCETYKELRHLRYLGVPGFDHNHSRALISVIKACGNQCGSGGIFEVQKSGGTWQRAEPTNFTRECSWTY